MEEESKQHHPKKKIFSHYFYNLVTYIGVWITFIIFSTILFLFAADMFFGEGNLYQGLIAYVFLPPVLFFGILLIPAGAYWKYRRVEKGVSQLISKPLRIDPRIPAHRNAVFVFMTGLFALIIMTMVGSYKAFHFTESVEFCGTLCHTVMEPEYTVYKQSPHARVDCVKCHIGPGADWYVKAKISGARQIINAMTNNYSRPIPPSIEHLRPAKETCLECHWSEKLYRAYDFRKSYYQTGDDGDLTWRLRMLLPVGAGEGGAPGVHSHMNVNRDIYYVSYDREREEIHWVKTTDLDGKTVIYTTEDSPYKDREPPAEEIRKMDCMDCHNRPSHRFYPPSVLVNEDMQKGKINPKIPGIKEISIKALTGEYASVREAEGEIQRIVKGHYAKKEPEVAAAFDGQIQASVTALQEIYRSNMFPEMKADWRQYPHHIGHMITAGCFRCHDDSHRSDEGKVISRDCQACHTIVEQGPEGEIESNLYGLDFRHPVDIAEDWKETLCHDCHTGGSD